MKICYFDAFAGISGDMTVGALLDAGANAVALIAALESLGTGAQFTVEKTKRRGIAASKFYVNGADTKKHRHLPHIVQMIDGGALSDRARANAKLVFQKLGESESAVHGTPIEKVHFHEVGAVDSIADIVGACVALDLLGVEAVVCSPINVGSGTVSTEHGIMPVPAPATALLLKGKPIYSRGPASELATPTGAAIVTALAGDFGAMPALRIESIGYGAGDKDFAEHANVLRAMIGETSGARESTMVEVIEANIDDSTPEVLGWAMERLLDAGALDVTMQPLLMKKSRPGTLLRVLARPEDREKLAGLMMTETSSLGVRFYSAERRVQARRIVEVETPHGRARVKVAESGAFAPEYEDCRTLARATGLPLQQILSEVSQAYTKNA
ncbi:MAG TPA: nickel pincer cofactor biosynthesis protein LarC [Bryobacteraceae bacterium]|jgi:pyridinium-3,5-bisthiocarboxylic acid mononucleotide nickel chelatase|nr:nickel pincer cofactor biosynthesis protein LarC [Bryobacteraceae bacterium]